MTTRILLVRHGATRLTAEDRFAGSNDEALSPAGREQARRLGLRLRDVDIAAVYASPMARTLETARIVADGHDVPIRAEPALREIDYGHWEGLTRDEVRSRFAQEYAGWESDALAVAPRGGEAADAVRLRAGAALRDIASRHRHRTVLLVSHKGTNRLLISDLLGLDARAFRERLEQYPAALNILDLDDRAAARLVLFNDVSHCGAHP